MSEISRESSLHQEGMSLRYLALHELTEKEILLSSSEFTTLKKSISLKGEKLYKGPFRNILGDNLFETCNCIIEQQNGSPTADLRGFRLLKSIPYSLSMGYEFGLELSRLFDCDNRSSEQAAWVCALGHTSASMLDIIQDDVNELFATATDLVFGAFKRAFATTQYQKQIKTNTAVIGNPFLNVFGRATEAFGRCVKNICKFGRKDIVEELQITLEALLNAEIPTDFRSVNPAMRRTAVYEHLRRRNSMPFWAEGLICMLHAKPHKDLSIEEWKEILLRFGDIIWITDDIVDLTDDLRSRHWNYLILKLAAESHHPLDEDPPGPDKHREIYRGIIRHNLVTSSIEQLSLRLEDLKTQYRSVHKSSERISKLVGLYICSNMISPCCRFSFQIRGDVGNSQFI